MSNTESDYARSLRLSFLLLEKPVTNSINALKLKPGSAGLDLGCGNGQYTILLSRAVGPQGRVTGLDSSTEFLAIAKKSAAEAGLSDCIDFQAGTLSRLPFADDTFDWLWCKDTFYPGAVIADPAAELQELIRVVKPGGRIAMLFWSSQVLLPGYAQLEARLMRALAETTHYMNVAPEKHFLRAKGWMQKAGLKDISAESFAADIRTPLSAELIEAVQDCWRMFFDPLKAYVDKKDWDLLQRLSDSQSEDCLIDRPDYYCLLTYSMFVGRV